tara:strand:- start:4623 stop:5513 length:891 start_codon:yes stop_codon:yes gene_type:complete
MGMQGVKDKKWSEAWTAAASVGEAKIAVRMGMVDTVAAYINKGYYLQFSRIEDTSFSVSFSAFMESFSDSYSSNFQQEPAFGRTDPLPYYQNTTRNIAMSWVLVAHNMDSAARNLNDVKTLTQMLYPTYSSHGKQRIFNSAPIIGLKYINLAQESKSPAGQELLAGTISSFTHTPDLEFGAFEETDGILPKVIRLTCTFNPIHSKTLGFDENGNGLSGKNFPYRNFGQIYNPGNPSETEMDQAYIQSFKDGTAGERNIKVDKAYNEVLEARMESILQDATDSDNPWAKIGKLFSGE